MRAKASTVTASKVHGANDNNEGADAELQLREALRQIPLLTPWTSFVAHDASYSDDLNHELQLRVQDVVFHELDAICRRLERQQTLRDATGLMPRHATRTLLESQLLVEAKRKLDMPRIVAQVKLAMQAATPTLTVPAIRPRRASVHAPMQLHDVAGSPRCKLPHKTSVITQLFIDKRAEDAAAQLAAAAEQAAVEQAQEAFVQRTAAIATDSSDSIDAADNDSSDAPTSHSQALLSVCFPVRTQTLLEAVDAADTHVANEHVTNFRNRPVTTDAGSGVERQLPPHVSRVRYIQSTRLGSLLPPPMKRILDEYPIPKDILDALERQRHYHMEPSSLLTSFDAVCCGSTGSSNSNDADECFVRRNVLIERTPVSLVLASLAVAPVRPVAPPRDVFQQHVLDTLRNDAVLLTEVRELYDETHDAYRAFRTTLHRDLELSFLVDLSFRTSLNSTSYFADDDDDGDSDSTNAPNVVVPARLRRPRGGANTSTSVSAVAAKWRLAKSNATRLSPRRGAIALHVQSDATTKQQRTALLEDLCAITPHEIQLLEKWATHADDSDMDDSDVEGYDPVAIRPALSARFDAVWHALALPVHERLDLAVKYSSAANAMRLADAVELWETTAALIQERDELLEIVRHALVSPQQNAAARAEENAMLLDLATTTMHVKEALLLTHAHVGDFVTLDGTFYLARMEHETTELRRLLFDSIECMKPQSSTGLFTTTTTTTTTSSKTQPHK